MAGRIKVHRKMLDWGWYKDTNTFRVFFHLLLNANIEENQYMGHTIRIGDCVTGLYSLSETLGITAQSIRTTFNHLKSTNEITIKSTNKFSIITICKWEEYQGQESKLTNKTTNKLTNHQQTTNKQLTTLKEYKNIRNKEDNDMFEVFWKAYPKKKGKAKAMLAWNKIDPSEYDIIMEGVRRYTTECIGVESKYIKRPQGWLNDRRWEDEDTNIEPEVGNKNHYDWYKRNIVGTKFNDIDGSEMVYKEVNYRRFLIYDRNINKVIAQEIYEKVRGEYIDLTN